MENDEEGCAPPTADVADFDVAARGENSMPAARGGNRMPKIPDAADEIEVLCAAKGNLEERQLQTTHLRTRRRARRPRAVACSLTAADTWRVAI